MYNNQIENDWVLLGDIIRNIEVPNMKVENFQLCSLSDQNAKYSVRKYQTAQYFIYLSHECDFNDGKREFYLIAPLNNIGLQIRKNAEAFEIFQNSNDVHQHPHYLNYFFFKKNTIIADDMCVDFTKMISFPASQKNLLKQNKCLELNKKNRMLLKTKLAYYFIHEH